MLPERQQMRVGAETHHRHYTESLIGGLPLDLREPNGRVGGKVVGVRSYGGLQDNMTY